MQQHGQGEVSTGRVAAHDDVAGGAACFFQDVPQRLGRLAQLGWVCGVGSEGVAGEEDGDVVAVVVDDLEDVQPELEVWRDRGQGEAASCITLLEISFEAREIL